jgi:hypothetical protein
VRERERERERERWLPDQSIPGLAAGPINKLEKDYPSLPLGMLESKFQE